MAGSVKGDGQMRKLIVKFDSSKQAVEQAAQAMADALQEEYGDQFVEKRDPFGNPWPAAASNPKTMDKSGDLASWTFDVNGLQVTMTQPKQGVMQQRGLPGPGGGTFMGYQLAHPNPNLLGNKVRMSLPFGKNSVWHKPVQEAVDAEIGKWLKK